MPISVDLTGMTAAPPFRSYDAMMQRQRENGDAADAYMEAHYPDVWVDDAAVDSMVEMIENLTIDTFVRVVDVPGLETTVLHNQERGHYLIVTALSDIHQLYDMALDTVSQMPKH